MTYRLRISGMLACCLTLLGPVAGNCQDELPSAKETTRVKDVVYGRKAGMALTMDVLKPAAPSGIGAIFLVSGGFNSDMQWTESGSMPQRFFAPLLDRGQTVFLVGHGAFPKFLVPEITADVHRAVRFIRLHASDYGVDPGRLGVAGISSGGFLSLTLGTMGKDGDPNAKDPVDRVSSRVQAVACFVPPTDLVDYGEPGRTVLEFEVLKSLRSAFGVDDLPREEQIAALRAMSPLHAVSAETAPVLIMHGSEDILVPVEQSIRFAAKLKEYNIEYTLDIREGAGHGWQGMEQDFVPIAEWFANRMPAEKSE